MFVVLSALLLTLIVLLRVACILPCARFSQQSPRALTTPVKAKATPRVMLLLGSGGHTGEMLRLVQTAHLLRYHRIWVTSSGDSSSLVKAHQWEATAATGQPQLASSVSYVELPRARRVGESPCSSLLSTLLSFAATARLLVRCGVAGTMPDLLMVNGPGTCIPLAYITFMIHAAGLGHTRIVYVESLARVKRLSVSGFLMLPIADRFLVQWESLAVAHGGRVEYHGILV